MEEVVVVVVVVVVMMMMMMLMNGGDGCSLFLYDPDEHGFCKRDRGLCGWVQLVVLSQCVSCDIFFWLHSCPYEQGENAQYMECFFHETNRLHIRHTGHLEMCRS